MRQPAKTGGRTHDLGRNNIFVAKGYPIPKYQSQTRPNMPVVASFYGIIVMMYYLDTKQHHLPHIHVKYQENEAVFSIPDGKLLEGGIKVGK